MDSIKPNIVVGDSVTHIRSMTSRTNRIIFPIAHNNQGEITPGPA
jgi:hypothetical protein